RPPLCKVPKVGAGVCRVVVGIVRDEVLDRLHWGVELGELNVGPLAEMLEKGESRLRRRLEVRDPDLIYRTHDLRAEGRVKLTQHVLRRWRFESSQDVASAYAVF